MPHFTLERKDNQLLITAREEIGSPVSVLKTLGDSQLAKLIDLVQRLLPEYALYPDAEDERNFVDNDEFDVVEFGTDTFLVSFKNGQTTVNQYELNEDELRELYDALREIRDDMEGELEIGAPVLSSAAGPTGPTGPMGPTGPAGAVISSIQTVVKQVDQEISENTDGTSVVLTDDDELFFQVGSDEVWAFEIVAFVQTESVSCDLKMSVDAPSDVSSFISSFMLRDNTDDTIGPNGAYGSVITVPGDPISHDFSGAATNVVDTAVHVTGSLRVGSISGTVVFQWSQLVEDSIPLVVREGSYLIARRAQ